MPRLIAAVLYADGLYPDRVLEQAIEPLRERGLELAGVLQRPASGLADLHPCDLLLEDLSSGAVTAVAEQRGAHARGCRLDVGLLTEAAEAVLASLHDAAPRLLVVNKFGKIEADGGGLRDAIAEAVGLGVPVLVGVPARNLDRWRAFAGALADELRPDPTAVAAWLAGHGLFGDSDAAAAPGVAAELA